MIYEYSLQNPCRLYYTCNIHIININVEFLIFVKECVKLHISCVYKIIKKEALNFYKECHDI